MDMPIDYNLDKLSNTLMFIIKLTIHHLILLGDNELL